MAMRENEDIESKSDKSNKDEKPTFEDYSDVEY